jgi:hypothetical protein
MLTLQRHTHYLFHIGIFVEAKPGNDEDVIILKDEKNENHRVSTSNFSVGLSVY